MPAGAVSHFLPLTPIRFWGETHGNEGWRSEAGFHHPHVSLPDAADPDAADPDAEKDGGEEKKAENLEADSDSDSGSKKISMAGVRERCTALLAPAAVCTGAATTALLRLTLAAPAVLARISPTTTTRRNAKSKSPVSPPHCILPKNPIHTRKSSATRRMSTTRLIPRVTITLLSGTKRMASTSTL